MAGASTFSRRMPPLATEVVDAAGLALLRRWIASLPRGRGQSAAKQ
jgi:hypothetical protein